MSNKNSRENKRWKIFIKSIYLSVLKNLTFAMWLDGNGVNKNYALSPRVYIA
jgi:hypothetical protein